MKYFGHDCQLKSKPVSILHKINHFSSLMPIDLEVDLPNILGNQFYKFKIKTFKNYE
jgi:hypothetical protein